MKLVPNIGADRPVNLVRPPSGGAGDSDPAKAKGPRSMDEATTAHCGRNEDRVSA